MTSDQPRLAKGTWVELTPSGPLHGLVVRAAVNGTVLVQLVVGEWMCAVAEPEAVDEPDDGEERRFSDGKPQPPADRNGPPQTPRPAAQQPRK